MIAFVLLAITSISIWFFGGTYFKGKTILKNAGLALALSSFALLFVWFIQGDLPSQMYYVAIGIFIIGFLMLWKIKKEKSNTLKIIANQHRYWNEITKDNVYSFFKRRKKEKKDRIEIDVNRERKKIIISNRGNEYIAPSFFIELENLQLTKADNYKEVNNSILYATIFKKLKGIIEDKEITDDYDKFFGKILEDNGGYLEYFLLYVWEEYTRDINIGTSYLELLAINNTEEQLVGALNIAFLHNIIFNGSALYFAYMSFHNRIFVEDVISKVDEDEDFSED